MSLLDNIKRMINPLSDEDDDYDELFDEQDSPFLDERPRSSERGVVDSRRGKVVNIHATTQLKVVLVKPERFEAASEIADHLKEKRTVVVNLESTHKDIARRLIDFLSGVGGQDQEGGRQYIHHHPLLRGDPGGSDRRAGEQRAVFLTFT